MFKKIIFLIIVIIIVAVALLYVYRNLLVETAVEDGSSYALGVETDLGSAGLDLGGGSLELNDYTISNPEGFEHENFCMINHAVLDVNEGSILDDEVVIDSFVIDGMEINLEQIDKKGNYLEILDNIKKIDVSSSESGNQKFHIKKIELRNISLNSYYNVLGNKGERALEIKDFTLTDVGGENGVTIGEITSIVINKVLVKAVSANKNAPLKENLKKLEEKAGEVLKDVTDDVSEKAEELKKSLFGN